MSLGIQQGINKVLSLAGMLGAVKERGEIKKERADMKAKKALQIAQTQKRRRNFLQYMANQSTSFGKFGDLPLEKQKYIAKTYSPYQRKKIMDAEDARRGKK